MGKNKCKNIKNWKKSYRKAAKSGRKTPGYIRMLEKLIKLTTKCG